MPRLQGLGITGLKIDGAAKVRDRVVVAPHIPEGPAAVGDGHAWHGSMLLHQREVL
jgi:hypothetical protein